MAAPRRGRPLRLLLDTHHSRRAAQRLRDLGHDVVAASDDLGLATAEDAELLGAATEDGRVVVTENVKDFDRIVREWAAAGRHHAGVIFTSPRRFHRGGADYPGNLIKALDQFVDERSGDLADQVHWL